MGMWNFQYNFASFKNFFAGSPSKAFSSKDLSVLTLFSPSSSDLSHAAVTSHSILDDLGGRKNLFFLTLLTEAAC